MYLHADNVNDTLSSLITYNSSSIYTPKLYIYQVAFIQFISSSDGSIIYANSSITVTLTNCVFTNNTAANGGSVYFNNTLNSSITITDCQFITNKATISGGAIYFDRSNYNINIVSSKFYGNSAATGGGALFFYSSNKNIKIFYTEFISNKELSQVGIVGGGAINFMINVHELIYIYNCTFISNSAYYGIKLLSLAITIMIIIITIRWWCSIKSKSYHS